jgi:methylmalonyl-CoA/ethylmalonyl-CoA epimerase
MANQLLDPQTRPVPDLPIGASALLDGKRGFHKNIKRIDHLAIAVHDLEGTVQFMTGILGAVLVETRITRGARTAMEAAVVQLGDFTLVLARGLHPDSHVSRFVERYGPGVQHIAVEVFSLDEAVRALKEAGMRFRTEIYDCGKLRQIFTERNAESAMMFEFIERVDADYFDERNIQRLYDDMEEGDLI